MTSAIKQQPLLTEGMTAVAEVEAEFGPRCHRYCSFYMALFRFKRRCLVGVSRSLSASLNT